MGFLSIVFLWLIPGILWAGALFPEDRTLSTSERLIVGIVLGLSQAVVSGLILVDREWLGPGGTWTMLGIASAIALPAAVARRWSPVATWRTAVSDFKTPAGKVAVALIMLIAGAHVLRQQLYPWVESLVAWYYFGDILEMLQSASIPQVSVDYGMPMHFETDKISWYLVMAQWLAISGLRDDPIRAMETMVVVMVSMSTLAAWIFFRSTLSRTVSVAVATVIMLAAPRMVWKLAGFRGEAFGIMLFLCGLWAVHRVLTTGSWRWHALVAIIVALLATAHMVPAVCLVFWYGASLCGQFVVEGRAALSRLPPIFASAAMALLLTLSIWKIVGKDTAAGQSALSNPETLTDYRGYDPTSAFMWMVSGRELSRRVDKFVDPEPAHFYVPPAKLFSDLMEWTETPILLWPGPRDRLWPLFAVLISYLVWTRHPRGKRSIVTMVVFFVVLYAWGLFFSYRYHTFLPAEHPNRREFPFFQVMLPLVIGQLMDVWFHHAPRWLPEPKKRMRVQLLTLIAILYGPVISGYRMLENPKSSRTIPADGRRALAWLREHTDPAARVAFDGTTDGIVQVLAQRVSVTEGRAPYFQPANLMATLDVLREAMFYFRHPEDPTWLRQQNVDFVVAGSDAIGARMMRGSALWGDKVPHLELQRRFGRLRIYKVVISPDEIIPAPTVTAPPRRPLQSPSAEEVEIREQATSEEVGVRGSSSPNVESGEEPEADALDEAEEPGEERAEVDEHAPADREQ